MPAVDVPSIVAAEDRYHPALGEQSAAEAVVHRFWRHGPDTPAHMRGQPKGPLPTVTHPDVTAFAYVNHGRWCVDCPFPGCASAQYACREDHRFFCVECNNGGTGQWVPVAWPAEAAAIEALLTLRPEATTRNWRPPETPADLQTENAERGIR